MYKDHISYFHSVHTLASNGFTVINFSDISRIYTEHKKILHQFFFPNLAPVLFQTRAFENNEVKMNRQVISNRFYASEVKLFSALWRNSHEC